MQNIYKTSSSIPIFSDYPDPDVIRVDDTYYMVSTTMHFMPGCVILRSYNLLDWEIASYVYDSLESTPGCKLEDNNGVYGHGMWAASLRYHNNTFYVCFVANDVHKTFLFTSKNINGPWKKSEIEGFYHDLSLLFDDDGRKYLVSGNTNIQLTELNDDLSAPKKNGFNKTIIKDTSDFILGYEGSHFYKINGKYYIFFIHWPKGKFRTQACFVSDKIDGPYSGGDVLCSDLFNWESGVAQGGIVDDGYGNWYGLLFQDHGALGRIPVLVNVEWENDFPVFGVNNLAAESIKTLDFNPDYKYEPLFCNDFFENPNISQDSNSNYKMKFPWQFNHNPDKNFYNFLADKKTGTQIFSITTCQTVKNPCLCKNTLTQRAFTEKCFATVNLRVENFKDGDFAGLMALEGDYGFIALTKKNGKMMIVLGKRKSPVEKFKIGSVDKEEPELLLYQEISVSQISFMLEFSLEKEKQRALFYYSLLPENSKNSKNGIKSLNISQNPKKDDYTFTGEKDLQFTLDHFTGCRFALFNYSSQNAGSTAFFSDFNYHIK